MSNPLLKSLDKTLLSTAGFILAPLLVVSCFQIPFAMPTALFFSVILLWLTECVPLPATALLIPVLTALYGIASPKEAFVPFGNQIIFLFIGAFLLAEAMEKHKWDKRMAYIALSRSFVSTPSRLISVVALVCWCLSMWISNTATCAIMMPICVGIIHSLGSSLPEKDQRSFATRLLLTCAFASSIGGMATPVGSPPNALAIEFLREMNIRIGFLKWMMFGLPVSILMLILLNCLLAYRYPITNVDLSSAREDFVKNLESLGRIKKEEIQVVACFSLAVFLWLLPGLLTILNPDSALAKELHNRMSMGGVALLAALPLFVLPAASEQGVERNLTWEDAKNIDWGTVILFGGGLCLGTMLSSSGLAEALGEQLKNLHLLGEFTLGILVISAAILMSEFSSNTASASILIPIVLSLDDVFGGISMTSIIIAAAFGASFGFMLPVSTPPNAIVFGTGKIELREMIRSGSIFDLLGLLIIAVFMLLICG